MRYWDSMFHNAIGSVKHNWLVLKNIFRYLQGMKHLVLVFQFRRNLNTNIIGYIDHPTMSDRRQVQCSYQVWQPSHGVFETDLMATFTNHYLNDNVSCVALIQTCYIISNITILHLASQIMQLICSPSLYQLLHSRNMFMELVSDGFGICKNQGEYLPELFLFKASYYTLFPFMSLLYKFS